MISFNNLCSHILTKASFKKGLANEITQKHFVYNGPEYDATCISKGNKKQKVPIN